jgi:dihydrofolate synthase/folylpolyglutamate synthase
MAGTHQCRNANLAWQMLMAQQRLAVPRTAFLDAIAEARWPARFQRLADGPLTGTIPTWLDGAHNLEAAAAVAAVLAEIGPMHIVLGILANKDADSLVAALRPHALSLTFVPVPEHAHHDPRALAERFGGEAASSIEAALRAVSGPRLVAGSLYLAGQVLAGNGEVPD